MVSGVQIATKQIDEGIAAGRMAAEAGATWLDLNCGCPIYGAHTHTHTPLIPVHKHNRICTHLALKQMASLLPLTLLGPLQSARSVRLWIIIMFVGHITCFSG